MTELDRLSSFVTGDQVVLYSIGLGQGSIRAAYRTIPDAVERLEKQRLESVNTEFYD